MMRMSGSPYKVWNGKQLKESLDRAKSLLWLLPLILGLLVGAAAIRRLNAAQQAMIASVAQSFISARSNGWFRIFRSSMILHSSVILLAVFLAFSLIGAPLIPLLPLAEGLGIGAISGYLYNVHHFAGIGYCLVFLYPSAAVAIFSHLLCCSDCTAYSRNAYHKAILGRGETSQHETRKFLIRQVVYFIICVGSAALEATFGALFSGLFVL